MPQGERRVARNASARGTSPAGGPASPAGPRAAAGLSASRPSPAAGAPGGNWRGWWRAFTRLSPLAVLAAALLWFGVAPRPGAPAGRGEDGGDGSSAARPAPAHGEASARDGLPGGPRQPSQPSQPDRASLSSQQSSLSSLPSLPPPQPHEPRDPGTATHGHAAPHDPTELLPSPGAPSARHASATDLAAAPPVHGSYEAEFGDLAQHGEFDPWWTDYLAACVAAERSSRSGTGGPATITLTSAAPPAPAP